MHLQITTIYYVKIWFKRVAQYASAMRIIEDTFAVLHY